MLAPEMVTKFDNTVFPYCLPNLDFTSQAQKLYQAYNTCVIE